MTRIEIRKYDETDLPRMTAIWNAVVEEGNAFPQSLPLGNDAAEFFAAQSFVGVAETNGEIVGLYILHPNNVGRCGHIANASFAVDGRMRGRHIGEKLVRHCLITAKALGFRILQFNAVVASNAAAITLYEKLGFVRLGTIPEGFYNKTGEYDDIFVYYIKL